MGMRQYYSLLLDRFFIINSKEKKMKPTGKRRVRDANDNKCRIHCLEAITGPLKGRMVNRKT